MFNIGPLEILTVLVIALVVVGPKRLPELARMLGRGLNEFRKIQDEVKDMVKFDLGADLLGEDDEPAPSYDLAHPELEDELDAELEAEVEAEVEPELEPEPEGSSDDGSVDDGMTHSERVIATLPDDEQEVTALPAVSSASGAASDEEPALDGQDPAGSAPDEPPAAAAE